MIEYVYDNYGKINEDKKARTLREQRSLTTSLCRLNCFFSKFKNVLILQVRRRAHSQQRKYLILLFLPCSAPACSIHNFENGKNDPTLITWDNFCTFFKKSQSGYLKHQDMTAQQGSQTCANATAMETPNISDTFEHLAAATSTNCMAVANLTPSNQALSEELQVHNTNYKRPMWIMLHCKKTYQTRTRICCAQSTISKHTSNSSPDSANTFNSCATLSRNITLIWTRPRSQTWT